MQRIRLAQVTVVRAVLIALLMAAVGAITSAEPRLTVDTTASGRAPAVPAGTHANAHAVDEMWRGQGGRERRWMQRPHLVVVSSVMTFEEGPRSDFRAVDARLTSAEVEALIRDLTAGLAVLSGTTFNSFASVRIDHAVPGAVVRVVRDGDIVAGRFRGVRERLKAVGYGGRTTRADGTILSGTVMLDEDYDRTDARRTLLRMHELGHALGYNHVESRRSIMNATLGVEPTEVDRMVARLAFSHFAPAHGLLARND